MTPIEIAESVALKLEEAVKNGRGEKYPNASFEAALAARCIRAVIEAAKEENWESTGGFPEYHIRKSCVDGTFLLGAELFQFHISGDT